MSEIDDIAKAFDEFDKSELERQMKVNLTRDYIPSFEKEFTKDLHLAVQKAIINKEFLLIDGGIGTGKTTAVKKQVNARNYQLVTYDCFDDIKSKKTELKTYITSVNTRPIVLFFENIDRMKLPDWFFTYKNVETKNSFLDIAKKYSIKSNVTIVATSTNMYNMPFDLKKEYFITYRHKLPHKRTLDRFVKNKIGVNLPTGFPKDLHQVHLFIKYFGHHTAFNHEQNDWNEVRNFFKKSVFGLPKTKVELKHWAMVNILEKPFFLPKHSTDFLHYIAVLCLNDLYDTDDFFIGTPPIESVKWDWELYYPTYVRDE